MITAKQALIKAMDYNANFVKIQLSNIEKLITEASNSGDYNCVYGYVVTEVVSNELKNLGFKVEVEHFRDEVNTIISWG